MPYNENRTPTKGNIMQSTYSVYGSPIHLILDDEFAQNYNNAQKAFFEAQLRFKSANDRPWTGQEALDLRWTEKEREAFNGFADLMNTMIKLNGGSLALKAEDMTSDYLVKL